MYINPLDDTANKYNNTYHRTIKMKPVDEKWNTYINSSEQIHAKDSKFKIGDIVRISKYEKIFAKGYVPNWSKVFVITKIKNTVPWTYVVSDFKGEEIVRTFYKKELQKVIKRQGVKLYFKWKGYNNSFNSWVDKKDIV